MDSYSSTDPLDLQNFPQYKESPVKKLSNFFIENRVSELLSKYRAAKITHLQAIDEIVTSVHTPNSPELTAMLEAAGERKESSFAEMEEVLNRVGGESILIPLLKIEEALHINGSLPGIGEIIPKDKPMTKDDLNKFIYTSGISEALSAYNKEKKICYMVNTDSVELSAMKPSKKVQTVEGKATEIRTEHFNNMTQMEASFGGLEAIQGISKIEYALASIPSALNNDIAGEKLETGIKQ